MARKRRFVSTLFAAAGTLAASFLIGYRFRSQPLPPQGTAFIAKARPFMAEGVVRHFATQGDSGPKKVDHTTYARKSDRSWVEVTTTEAPDGKVAKMSTIWNVASGERVTVEPFTKSIMTYYLTTNEMRDEIERQASCAPDVTSPTADHDQILGYDVIKVVEENPAPQKAKERVEAWVAPELDCYILRETELRSDGPHNEVEVTHIEEGEPPAALFEVPADYVERSPSELSTEWETRFGHKLWREESITKRMDKQYYASRPQSRTSLK